MVHSRIVPAIIPRDSNHIADVLARLGAVSEIHVDVVDGEFVPATSWPYHPVGDESSVETLLKPYTLEVDLMVARPYEAGERWVAAGADMLVFHIETITPALLEEFAARYSVTIGISLTSDTPVSDLVSYAAFSDYVQVMGIREIGLQGQSFDEQCLSRIDEIRSLMPTHFISIDGSVNAETIPHLLPHHPDRFIVGSAIVQSENPRTAFESLHALVSSTG